MSRGPQPRKAQNESLPIAERRGLVQRYQHRQGNICNFSVICPGLVSFVCVMRLVRLSSTPEDILHDFAAVIGRLRFIASSPAISRELWLRTPRGAWRFFRVLDDGILELDRDGMPLTNGTGPVKGPASATGTGLAANLKRALHAGKRSWSRGGKSAGTDGAKAGRAVVPALVQAQPPDTPASPVTDPEPEKIPATENTPVTELSEGGPFGTVSVEKTPDAAQGPMLSADPAPEAEQEKIPDIIQKFLRRRSRGPGKDPATG